MVRTLFMLFVFMSQGCNRSADSFEREAQNVKNQSIEENTLYRNALSSGFNMDASFKSSSDSFQKRLLGLRYLRYLAIENITVSKEEVFAYYKKEISGFRRIKNQVKVYHLYTYKKSEAEGYIQSLSSAGKKNEKNELFLKYKIQPRTVSSGELIPELEKVLFQQKSKKRLHGPIKSIKGYHVLFILERFSTGTVVPIEEVYDEIYQRVFQKKYALKSLHVLDSLLNHTPYI